jgi:hypothetical protein
MLYFLYKLAGWGRWKDISVFHFHYQPFLLQGRVNKWSNQKHFKITSMIRCPSLNTTQFNISEDKLIESGMFVKLKEGQ